MIHSPAQIYQTLPILILMIKSMKKIVALHRTYLVGSLIDLSLQDFDLSVNIRNTWYLSCDNVKDALFSNFHEVSCHAALTLVALSDNFDLNGNNQLEVHKPDSHVL